MKSNKTALLMPSLTCCSQKAQVTFISGMSPVKLVISQRPGDTSVKEKTQLIDEKVSHKTVEVIDEKTGKPTIQTLQLVQKVVETEVVQFISWSTALQ